MAHDHIQLAHDFVTMVNERDADAVDRLLTEDYVDHNAMIGGTGREPNRVFWKEFFAAFPDVTATLEDVVASGDRLVGRYVMKGTHLGTFQGIPATGNAVRMQTIDLWHVKDGRFAEHWDEVNVYDLLQQLGVIPATPTTADEAA